MTKYRFASERTDNSDLAGGRVLYSAPGFPGFPVRLASEVFLRALAHQASADRAGDPPVSLWDPCCGSGALLTTLGFLHGESVGHLLGTDVSESAVEVARRNLALLTLDGLERRERELRDRAVRFGKSGYTLAADSARRLDDLLKATGGDRYCAAQRADVFDQDALARVVAPWTPDLAIFDAPYGEQTEWIGAPPDVADPTQAAVENVARVMSPSGVIAIVARTRRVPVGDRLCVLERFRAGNRAVAILAPRGGGSQGRLADTGSAR